MEYFKMSEAELISKGAFYTAKEISEQPRVWKNTFGKVIHERQRISGFWDKAKKNSRKIILTGAGTSAYIGFSLEGAFQRHTGITTVSVATTHLVTHPMDYLHANEPTLIISFARSGNSPESVAAVKLADSICNECYHLIITCDGEGELAKFNSVKEKYVFILPPEANDQSLAMTSSYSGMLLAGLLLARLEQVDSLKEQVMLLIKFGEKIIGNYYSTIKEIADLYFERAVFLGSGPLFGTATESHLKLQELTDGRIICKSDSFLGFRHGPKAIIDEKTLVLFLFSNKNYVHQYERDLVNSVKNGKAAMLLVGVSDSPISHISLDVEIWFSESGKQIEEEFLPVCSILPAQILGLFKSLQMGLSPDNPSISGAISRVVEGVVIYEDKLLEKKVTEK